MLSGDSKIVRKLTRGQLYLEEMSLDVGNIFRDFQNKLLEPSRKNIPIKNGGNLGGITVTGSKSAKKTPYKWSSPRGSGNMTFTGNSVAIPILEGLGHVGKAFTKGVSSFAASASSTPTMGGYNNPYVPYTHFNQDVLNLVENILDEKVLPAVTPTNYLAALFTEGSLDPYRGAEIKSHWSPIMLLSSVPVDILAAKGTIKSGPKVIKTTANGVKTATKAVDNVVREFYPAYDLYRTIGETTPRTTPTIHAFNIDKKYFAMTGSPLFEFARMMRTSPEKAYFMRAPKDVDVLRLNNGSFRHEVVGDEILPSGKVNGKFVSYGEPWKEFGFGENDALYEFPIGSKRGPSLMATDWKGRLREYSVDEVYDYMQQKKLLEKELKSMDDLPLNEYLSVKQKLIDEKYPALNKYIDTSIYGANQTVISNKKWNFDKFLKSPFWKYSENPITGLVQKELFIQLPQINLNPNRTSLKFFERQPSKLSLAERVGVPKGDRGNLSLNLKQAIEDLVLYRNSGLYRQVFRVTPDWEDFGWNLSRDNPTFMWQFAVDGKTMRGPWARVLLQTPTGKGVVSWNSEKNMGGYSSKMFKLPLELKYSPGEANMMIDGPNQKVILTSPRVDIQDFMDDLASGTIEDLNLFKSLDSQLKRTIDKDVMKDFWVNSRKVQRPGSYMSGDNGRAPLGSTLIEAFKKKQLHKTPILERPIDLQIIRRTGLSPDSYSSIIRLGNRDGSLRWGEGFTNWNNSAIENKFISDAFRLLKNKEITPEQYEKIFNEWSLSIGGRPLLWVTIQGLRIPVHPHPYIYAKKQGGKIKTQNPTSQK